MSMAKQYPATMTIQELHIKNEVNRGLVWAFLAEGERRDHEFVKNESLGSGTIWRCCAVRIAAAEQLIQSSLDAKEFAGVGAWLTEFIDRFFAKTSDCSKDTSTGSVKQEIPEGDRPQRSETQGAKVVNPLNAGLHEFLVQEAMKCRENNRKHPGTDWQSVSYFKAARSVANAEIHIGDYKQAVGLRGIGKVIAGNIQENFFTRITTSASRKHRLLSEDAEAEKPSLKRVECSE